MTELDRDAIFLLLAQTESATALRAIDELERLASVREEVQPGVARLEKQRVFDHIRLALQCSANVSKIFWPQASAAERGIRLRTLVGLPEFHPLRDRRLRNHIEHIDERLDIWTRQSPRPFLATETILHWGIPDGEARDAIIEASTIVYDANTSSMILFGNVFLFADLRSAVFDVQDRCSSALSEALKRTGI